MRSSKIVRRIFFLLLASGSIWWIARFCHAQTSGFRLLKIKDNFAPFTAESSIENLPADFFNQRFTFFGRGFQSFAFLSEDGQYVLKIFNNRHQHKISLFGWMPWMHEKKAQWIEQLEKTYHSYKIAFEELKAETGLIGLHLSPTDHLQKMVILIDKLGIEHSISLDQTGFLLQRRAILVYPKLLELKQKKDLRSAQEAIEDLLHLLLLKFNRSIHDNDPLIRTNFGFIGKKAIQIDVGPFSKETITNWKEEMIRITTSLKIWVRENYPELSPFLEDQLIQMLK
jgi:hypothetical protein